MLGISIHRKEWNYGHVCVGQCSACNNSHFQMFFWHGQFFKFLILSLGGGEWWLAASEQARRLASLPPEPLLGGVSQGGDAVSPTGNQGNSALEALYRQEAKCKGRVMCCGISDRVTLLIYPHYSLPKLQWPNPHFCWGNMKCIFIFCQSFTLRQCR